MMIFQHDKIQEFIEELNNFANKAEDTLSMIEQDLDVNKSLFSIFSERMFAIRGTAQQLNFPRIGYIAGLGEEIAIKGIHAKTRSQVRKCVGSLWDALTSVKYLLQNYEEETEEEQNILIHRLEMTLQALGGPRTTINESEIEDLIRCRK